MRNVKLLYSSISPNLIDFHFSPFFVKGNFRKSWTTVWKTSWNYKLQFVIKHARKKCKIQFSYPFNILQLFWTPGRYNICNSRVHALRKFNCRKVQNLGRGRVGSTGSISHVRNTDISLMTIQNLINSYVHIGTFVCCAERFFSQERKRETRVSRKYCKIYEILVGYVHERFILRALYAYLHFLLITSTLPESDRSGCRWQQRVDLVQGDKI